MGEKIKYTQSSKKILLTCHYENSFDFCYCCCENVFGTMYICVFIYLWNIFSFYTEKEMITLVGLPKNAVRYTK